MGFVSDLLLHLELINDLKSQLIWEKPASNGALRRNCGLLIRAVVKQSKQIRLAGFLLSIFNLSEISKRWRSLVVKN